MQGEKTPLLVSDGLLLLTALVWGFGFVAQRAGMEHVGPLTYNGVRFLLGSVVLLPLALVRQGRGKRVPLGVLLRSGAAAGSALFTGATLQQIGLQTTSAGRAGFITGLYVIFVPIFGLWAGRRTSGLTWIGGMLAVAGMYLLSVRQDFTLGTGDLLVLAGAVFWALHVLVLDHLSKQVEPVALSVLQFAFCGLLSLALAPGLETITLTGLRGGLVPILYGGLVSVGIGYTLQVVAQQHAHPAHAAILLSLEAVFAALGGWLLLDELLDVRAQAGCALMLAGMIISQLQPARPLPRDNGQSRV